MAKKDVFLVKNMVGEIGRILLYYGEKCQERVESVVFLIYLQ